MNNSVSSIKNTVTATDVYKNEPFGNEVTFKTMDSILENEKIINKTDTWNKLNKYERCRLHAFAESHGKTTL
jgi:hypothetical protein